MYSCLEPLRCIIIDIGQLLSLVVIIVSVYKYFINEFVTNVETVINRLIRQRYIHRVRPIYAIRRYYSASYLAKFVRDTHSFVSGS